MSRIGKMPIDVPANAKISIEGNAIKVVGPLGSLSRNLPPRVSLEQSEGRIVIRRTDETRTARCMHGLARTLINNMVVGVTEGFTKELFVTGVGYKVDEKGKDLVFTLGHSHPVDFPLPEGIKAKVDRQKQIKIILEGYDKELLGQVAAKMRSMRAPEPYKGKGVQYASEVIVRKAGKAAGKKK